MKTLFLIAILYSQVAMAAPVTLEISGHITSVDFALTSHYTVDSPFTINLIYDPAEPNIGTAHLTTSGHDLFGSGPLWARNNVPFDEFTFPYVEVTGLNIPPFDIPRLSINFVDFSSALFNNETLPDPFPQMSQWSDVSAFLGYEDSAVSMDRRVNFHVEMVVVPEPTISWLLLIACSLLFLRRSRIA